MFPAIGEEIRNERENDMQVVRFFYSLYRIKNTMKKLPQIIYRLANDFLNLNYFKMIKNIYYKIKT
jgi:hypothetical protein